MISVAIPTLDGAADLDRTLAAVRRQRVEGDVEVVVLDSESTDGTVEVARRHGAVVHTIERRAFSHGGARNRLMRLTRGDRVAFLTQDAEPLEETWLARLVGALDRAPDVGVACGPYRARPDASPILRRELEGWFAAVGAGPAVVRRADLPVSPAPVPAAFASSANLCLEREAWEAVPFREIAYAEDQQLVLDLLDAGWAKAWVGDAPVLHSHAFPPLEQVGRWFDEFRALHEVHGWVAPRSPRAVLGRVRAEVRHDRAAGVPAAASAAYHLGRAVTAVLATRADGLPAGVRRALSRDGRA